MTIKHSSRHGHMGLAGEGGWLREVEIGEDILTTEERDGKFDAMVCWWEFTEEFLAFRGPKLFYCCEPSFYFRGWRRSKRELRSRLSALRSDEFAWHGHSDPRMRVPHETSSFSDPSKPLASNDIKSCVTVLNNLGNPFSRNRGRQKRAEMVVASGCDIFGPKEAWNRFRLHFYSKKGPPQTYRGPCPAGEKLAYISRYHSCICFENSCEPEYFTEKFPDAVRAGCVPIYHAHPAVREKFLDGAVWVDPADYGFDGRAAMEAALKMDRAKVAEQNHKWLEETPVLQGTQVMQIYVKMGEILRRKMTGEICLPGSARRPNLPDEYL